MWVEDSANSSEEEFSSAGDYLNKQIETGYAAYLIYDNEVALDGQGEK